MRKLSKSGYEDNLILKGGLFIYTLTNFESRATIDIDFLLRSVSNSLKEVQALIVKILATFFLAYFLEVWHKLSKEPSSNPLSHSLNG